MDRSRSFRHLLLRRFFVLLGLSVPATGVAMAACGVHVPVDGTSANTGGGVGLVLEDGQCGPAVSLGDEQRARLAEAWASEGLRAHAKVASFGRFALDLLALGAPASLVADAHRAALDEVRHARMLFDVASSYAGRALVPGPFDFGRGAPAQADVASLSERAFVEGCVGETLAAVEAEESLAASSDPATQRALRAIADDGARHAELGWRTIAWCLQIEADRASVGEQRTSHGVRSALLDVIERLQMQLVTVAASPSGARGRDEEAALRTLSEVVLPCARELLRSREIHAPRHASPVDLPLEVAA